MNDKQELLSLKEVSQMLHLHPNTLRKWDNNGLLKAVRFGTRGDRSYYRKDVLKLLEKSQKKDFLEKHPVERSPYVHGEILSVRKRFEQIHMLSSILSKPLSSDELLKRIPAYMLTLLDATNCIVFTVSEGGETLEVKGHSSYQKIPPAVTKISLSYSLPITDAVKFSEAIMYESGNERREKYPQLSIIDPFPNAQAYVALPLIASQQTYGVIGIDFSAPRTFHKDDIMFMTYLTRQCALALERAYFYEEEKKQNQKIEQMRKLLERIDVAALHLLKPQGFETTCMKIVEEAKKLVGAEFGSIFLLQNGELERTYTSLPLLHQLKITQNGLTMRTFTEKKPAMYSLEKDHHAYQFLSELGIHFMMHIPLCYEDESIGVLAMLCSTNENLSPEKLQALKIFGSFATLAIKNTQKSFS